MNNGSFTLSNGVLLPALGFGTYKSKNGQEAFSAVLKALECGYSLIDTAEFYGNEENRQSSKRVGTSSRRFYDYKQGLEHKPRL